MIKREHNEMLFDLKMYVVFKVFVFSIITKPLI